MIKSKTTKSTEEQVNSMMVKLLPFLKQYLIAATVELEHRAVLHHMEAKAIEQELNEKEPPKDATKSFKGFHG